MATILMLGIIIFMGFLSGEVLKRFGLPKVTGFILGGVLLNPEIFKIIPRSFVAHTDLITNISLSFITFSVGGTLLFTKIRKLGKTILWITFWEAETAFLMVFAAFVIVLPFLGHIPHASMLHTFIPLSLLIGCLASPTDPSATLAVAHEYKAKGDVSTTIMGVAALDDVLGIVNYSFAVIVASLLITQAPLNISTAVLGPVISIGGAVLVGIFFGMIFNFLTNFFNKETEGALIVIIFSLLFICFGIAMSLNYDELLATMSMGVVVVNFNPHSHKIFNMLQRYTEELIFVIFFVLSGMHLKCAALPQSFLLILVFFVFRTTGKFFGTYTGALLSGAKAKVKKYTAGGLIPQGGIVVGLALLMHQKAAFADLSELIMSVIIGATILHEFIGPVVAKISLKKAQEI